MNSVCMAEDANASFSQRDLKFDASMVIARCRWSLALEADALTRRMLADGSFSPLALSDQLALAIAKARPRSRLIPWHLTDPVVERIINAVVADVAAIWK
jgi:hypothetical protein